MMPDPQNIPTSYNDEADVNTRKMIIPTPSSLRTIDEFHKLLGLRTKSYAIASTETNCFDELSRSIYSTLRCEGILLADFIKKKPWMLSYQNAEHYLNYICNVEGLEIIQNLQISMLRTQKSPFNKNSDLDFCYDKFWSQLAKFNAISEKVRSKATRMLLFPKVKDSQTQKSRMICIPMFILPLFAFKSFMRLPKSILVIINLCRAYYLEQKANNQESINHLQYLILERIIEKISNDNNFIRQSLQGNNFTTTSSNLSSSSFDWQRMVREQEENTLEINEEDAPNLEIDSSSSSITETVGPSPPASLSQLEEESNQQNNPELNWGISIESDTPESDYEDDETILSSLVKTFSNLIYPGDANLAFPGSDNKPPLHIWVPKPQDRTISSALNTAIKKDNLNVILHCEKMDQHVKNTLFKYRKNLPQFLMYYVEDMKPKNSSSITNRYAGPNNCILDDSPGGSPIKSSRDCLLKKRPIQLEEEDDGHTRMNVLGSQTNFSVKDEYSKTILTPLCRRSEDSFHSQKKRCVIASTNNNMTK